MKESDSLKMQFYVGMVLETFYGLFIIAVFGGAVSCLLNVVEFWINFVMT